MALTGVDVTGRGLVVFDFDGTLANTIGGITQVARQVLLAHGMAEADLGDLTRLVGPPFPQAFSMVYGLSEEEADAVTRDYRLAYADLGPAGWPLFDGVAGLLEDLVAAGKTLAVASSKRTALIEQATEQNGIAALFAVRAGKQDDYTDTKAATVGRVLERLGAGADDAVMVGDRRFDVEAAAANGMPCVGVRYGATCPRAELEDAGACAVAETVAELRALLLG